ncbi:predicted protein, partial [Phaeodactylum tricornutum CCAP 1055/1]
MGTYLSTPITEKNAESGESLDCPSTPVAWGVVDMQGWRKTMEDSHVAQTDIDVPAHHFEASHDPARHVDAKVFGVFDGHGGPEVARFCQLYLINVLTQQPTWQFESKTNAGNGRLTCNLPDHPIHAGATAIIAVIVGRTLTVANAGDSRAVLCRGGDTIAMSFDHKPFDNREISRITMAGGFVNQFGRVNGNLNLSRSIGDLKYKQGPIPPSEQMITAEPDITQILLEPRDEFVILGCDGIWDCLTNEQAVEYVRQRIETKTPAEIGTEMLDDIISVDPRVTQGIGGDNMTIMVVDL